MKRYLLFTVAVLSVTVLTSNLFAECQDDRMFGNGRFLRRLRDDITGKTSATPKATPKSNKSKAKPNAKEPTPAGKRPSISFPTPATPQGGVSKQSARRNTTARPTAVRSKASVSPKLASPKPTVSDSKRSKEKGSNMVPAKGFGMQLELKSDKFIVSKVDSRGNAQKAGIKRGDVILSAGGVELSSVEEFIEITKILGQGDQIELQVEQRGKEKDVVIQFGQVPKPDEITRVSPTKTKNDNSFIPQRDDNSQTGLRSVLNQQRQNAGSVDTQQTIELQRQQIEQLQREVQRLKRQSNASSSIQIAPATDDTIWKSPSPTASRK